MLESIASIAVLGCLSAFAALPAAALQARQVAGPPDFNMFVL